MGDRFVRNLLGLSFLKWWFLLVPKVAMIVFIAYVGYMGWIRLGPHKPSPDTARMKIADHAVEIIVDRIHKSRANIRSAALCHFANDTSDYFSHKLRERLEQTNIIDLTDMGFPEKLRTTLNMRIRGPANPREALFCANGEAVDGVLWGRIDRFESSKDGALITGEWQLLDKTTGDVVCSGRIQEGTGAANLGELVASLGESADDIEIAASTIPWHLRLLGFVLLVLLLPVATISFVRTMVSKRSNKINAFVLGIYTAIDMILAFFMIGGAFGSFAVVLAFLISSFLAFAYNVSLMTFALRLETE